MNYEQYHQKGGTYVIPVEVFNDLLNEKEELDKEKEELIDYLKEEKSNLHWEMSELFSGMCDIKFQEGKLKIIEEILSKIEKSDK